MKLSISLPDWPQLRAYCDIPLLTVLFKLYITLMAWILVFS